jgi:hypothetical protein
MVATKKMDSAEVEKAIAAVRDRTRQSTVPASQQIQIRNLRNKVKKELEPIFQRAGLDVEEINRILTQHDKDVRKVREEQKSQIETNLAARGENLRVALTQRSRTLDRIANKPFLTTTIPLQEALQIFAEPVGMLTDWGIEPQYNWGKIAFGDFQDETFGDFQDKNGTVYLRFYFFWQNTSDYLAVLNATTELSALGIIYATANPELLISGNSGLSCSGSFDVYVGSAEIYPPGNVGLGNVHAGTGWGPTVRGAEYSLIDGQLNSLSVSNIEVDSGEFAVLVVEFSATYDVYNGSIRLDFESGDNSIICPGVNLELLTPPS